eukprot:7201900-Prymnesium_polylepis.1
MGLSPARHAQPTAARGAFGRGQRSVPPARLPHGRCSRPDEGCGRPIVVVLHLARLAVERLEVGVPRRQERARPHGVWPAWNDGAPHAREQHNRELPGRGGTRGLHCGWCISTRGARLRVALARGDAADAESRVRARAHHTPRDGGPRSRRSSRELLKALPKKAPRRASCWIRDDGCIAYRRQSVHTRDRRASVYVHKAVARGRGSKND